MPKSPRSLGCPKSQITRLRQKARERGYDPLVSKQIKAEHVEDAPRSGRPEVIDEEKEKKVLDIVRATHESREMSIAELARAVGVGTTAVYKLFKKKKMGKYKPTYRPGIVLLIPFIKLLSIVHRIVGDSLLYTGLTAKMRKARLEFALKYKDKELEWWKNVIFSDETSIVLGR